MTSLDELKRKAFQDPEVKAEYERMELDFRLVSLITPMEPPMTG